jgi:hypothetical protein
MFVKQFFVICLLAASVKAAYVVLQVDKCDYYSLEFTQEKLGANDIVSYIYYNGPTRCDLSIVETVTFSRSSLYYLPAIFSTFENLYTLVLESTDLTEIRPYTFQLALSLSSIVFKNSSVKNLQPYAFLGAINLAKISIESPTSSSNSTIDPKLLEV